MFVSDVFFEVTADEVGYSMTGAFVDSSCFGCQFDEGVKKKNQPEMDMLYLQGNNTNVCIVDSFGRLNVHFSLLLVFRRSVWKRFC